MAATVAKELEVLRQNLLDLTLRNGLLNHRVSKRRTIEIIDESPREIFEILVLNEKSMQFKATKIAKKEGELIEDDQESDYSNFEEEASEDDLSNIWKVEDYDDIPEHYTDQYLDTPYDSETLFKKLFYTQNQSKTIFEEQGYSVLYLALGFLEWKDRPDSDRTHKSPLILIPVEMSRVGKRRSFSLSWTGEDISASLTLQGKMEEYGVVIPNFNMPETKEDIDKYLSSIAEEIKNKEGWNVLSDIVLDFFNFRKFVMYKDLDPSSWGNNQNPLDNPIINSIFNPTSPQENEYIISEQEVDEKVDPYYSYNVLDADSSQIAAIECVKEHQNLVIQGPPGTGKSQTITNIIAELLAKGKKVLFISEKMAALEVVKRRLDNIGIGDFCLELHSNKVKKRAVLDEIQKTIQLQKPDSIDINKKIDDLKNLKKELNEYVTVLHTPYGLRKLTPYELFSKKAKSDIYFEKKSKKLTRIEISNPEEINELQWNKALDNIEKIAEIIPVIGSRKNNPWRGCHCSLILPADRELISRNIGDAKTLYNELKEILKKIESNLGISVINKKIELNDFANSLELLIKAPDVNRDIIQNNLADESSEIINSLIKKIEKYNQISASIKSKYNTNIFRIDIDDTIDKHSQLLNKAKSEISSYSLFEDFSDFDEIFSLLTELVLRENKRHEIKNINPHIKGLFANYWKDEYSDYSTINNYREFISYIHENVQNGTISDKSYSYLENGIRINNLFSSNFHEKISFADETISILESYSQYNDWYSSKFKEFTVNGNLEKISEAYEQNCSKKLKFLSSEYRNLKKEINQWYIHSLPKNDDDVLDDIKAIIQYKELVKLLKSREIFAGDYFGNIWKGGESSLIELTDYNNLIKCLHSLNEQKDRSKSDSINHIIQYGISEKILRDYYWEVNLQNIDETINLIKEFKDLDSKLNQYSQRNYFELYSAFKFYYDNLKDVYIQASNSNVDFCVKTTIEDLNQIRDFLLEQKELNSSDFATDYFGDVWKGENSDLKEINEFKTWIDSFKNNLKTKRYSDITVEHLSNNNINHQEIFELKDNSEKLIEQYIDAINSTIQKLQIDENERFGSSIEAISFNSLSEKLELWEDNIEILDTWSKYQNYIQELNGSIAEPLIKYIENDSIPFEDLEETLKGNYADAMLKIVFVKTPILNKFVKQHQEKTIQKFRRLDSEIIKLNQKRLKSIIYSHRPDILVGASPNSEVGILQGELNRKRRIMPVRKLFQKTGSLIQGLKPCFMMSPLSVAQYLDPNSIKFDVIIFDEASQVRPEDSLGALMRGEQVVIVGDSKQLPPTRFFDSITENDQDDEEEPTLAGDIESILNLCRKSFPTKTLRWHYRSRHESLISVSNQEFYDNHLYVYPSPARDSDDLGLHFVHLIDTIYDRGRSGVNRKEARYVASMIIDHYKKNPNKTLGVGTFNVKQQDAILEELERMVSDNPFIEQKFTDPNGENLFIKNIETIQGDERDIIIISVGFGFDSNNKLTNNFGPLNQEGGERRLNVLITRAREKCIVVSNFTASDLQIPADAPFGLRALKTFLNYAETKELETFVPPSDDTDSPFEDSVYEFLRDLGYEIHKQVGCAGYRIDLAVIDAKQPGKYILGIECDGAQYHSSRVARDRDRLRQQVLEGLKWKIYRIWSTDWFMNKNMAQKELIDNIEKAKISPEYEERREKKVIIETSYAEPESQITESENISVSDLSTTEYNSNLNIHDGIEEYQSVESLELGNSNDVFSINKTLLTNAIIKMISVEGPIHKDQIINKIRSECGLKRTGYKIHDYLEKNINSIVKSDDEVIEKDGFLWHKSKMDSKILRKRSESNIIGIEHVCPEEIQFAILHVINKQGGTSKEDLILQSSRLLGYKAAKRKISEFIGSQIEIMIENNKLITKNNELLYINK